MQNIVRFDPFEDMSRLRREFNCLFDDSRRPTERGGAELASARTWGPAVDIDIEMTGDTLTLRGERKFEDTSRKDSYVGIERAQGHFQRSFTISISVRQDAVKASYRDGLLEVHLPKSEETRPKKVHITTE